MLLATAHASDAMLNGTPAKPIAEDTPNVLSKIKQILNTCCDINDLGYTMT